MAMFGSWGGGNKGGGGGGWGRPDRRRAAMADVLDRGDFGPKRSPAPMMRADPSSPQNLVNTGQSPMANLGAFSGGHDPADRKMAMRFDPNSPQNLVNSGQSVFQTGLAPPSTDTAMAPRQMQMPQRREMPVPSMGPKQGKRINTMGMGLRGPSRPAGAMPAAMGSYMGRR